MKSICEQLDFPANIAGRPWQDNSERLARWTLDHLVIRDDAHGRYYSTREGVPGQCKEDAAVDLDLLRRHFAGDGTIGLFTTSKDDHCRWLTIDVDRHGDAPETLVAANDGFTCGLYNSLLDMGFDPLLLDSNGRGGRHLTVLFDAPAPAREVRSFGLWLVRDWQSSGLLSRPEVFPKQDSIVGAGGEPGYGNFVRLFGRHPRRDHCTKAWDGKAWQAGDAAIETILAREGRPFSMAPSESLIPAKSSGRESRRGKEWWHEYEGNLKTLDVVALFRHRNLRAWGDEGDRIEVECPWAREHTTGEDLAGILAADPASGLFPTFNCFHAHCEGRTIEHVLAFFGKDAIDRHCRRRFHVDRGHATPGHQEGPIIEPGDPMSTAKSYRSSRDGTLLHHAGEWRRWDGRKYISVADADLRAGLWNWLESCRVEFKGVPTPCKPTRPVVTNLLEALKAVANLPSTTAMPCWISGQGGRPRPEDIIAFENGLFDVGRFAATGEVSMLPRTPNWFSDCCLRHGFDAQAACPEWLNFLREVFEGDSERIRTLAQWFGYNLTGDIRFHKFAFLLGPPRSGKGTILRVLGELLGAHNVANPTFASLGNRFGLAPLVGKLAAIVGDAHLGRQSDATAVLERLKSITGGDPQNIDRKFAPELANVPIKARFTIAANELPRFPDSSTALRSRMLVIPFKVSFEGREDVDLGGRLLEEIPGITNWALEGLRDLRRADQFLQPRAGRSILEDFARLSSPIQAFLSDRCDIGPDFKVPTSRLWHAWKG